MKYTAIFPVLLLKQVLKKTRGLSLADGNQMIISYKDSKFTWLMQRVPPSQDQGECFWSLARAVAVVKGVTPQRLLASRFWSASDMVSICFNGCKFHSSYMMPLNMHCNEFGWTCQSWFESQNWYHGKSLGHISTSESQHDSAIVNSTNWPHSNCLCMLTWRIPKIVVPPKHPKLVHFGIETTGDLGYHHFENPHAYPFDSICTIQASDRAIRNLMPWAGWRHRWAMCTSGSRVSNEHPAAGAQNRCVFLY